ncbi:MAG TPA: hypothetical protein DC049_15525, partial [Spirochaetia bacterium]|nr:hypothetical protein [Spirochaetia bacterium]
MPVKNFFIVTHFLFSSCILQAWYSNWAFREMITFSNAVDNDLTNFPVLLYISNHHYLKYCTHTNADDIVFSLIDGNTKLSHEIEYFNPNTGQLSAWIKMPVLDSSEASSNKVYMYYDITQPGNYEDATNVWKNAYAGVWHLGESIGSAVDSTTNNFSGTFQGTLPESYSGVIVYAQKMDQSDTDYITLNRMQCLEGGAQLTVSAWMYLNSTNGSDSAYDSGVFCKGAGGTSILLWYNADGTTDNTYTFNVGNSGTANNTIYGTGSIARPGEWHYVCGIMNGSARRFFFNGRLNTERNDATVTIVPVDTASACAGTWSGPGNFLLDGRIDELRVSSVARSSNWIATEYTNQIFPMGFRALGSIECGTRGIKIGGTISGAVSNNVRVIISNTVYYTTNSAADGT